MGKIKLGLPPAADLFSTQEERDEAALEKIREIPLTEIDGFPNHPFQVQDNEDMTQLAESVKKYGVLTPALVRKKGNGRYELISGHRRKRACELAGLDTIKCEVLELDDEQAVIVMVESNFQREHTLPSEKAFSYKMRLDAMKRQGQREDLTSAPLVPKLRTNQELGNSVGESHEQIRRYIRLTELLPTLLNMVDENKLPFRPAVEISYLKKDEQEILLEFMNNGTVPSLAQAVEMKQISQSGELTADNISEILSEKKKPTSITLRGDKLNDVIPETIKAEDRVDYIIRALEWYRDNKTE